MRWQALTVLPCNDWILSQQVGVSRNTVDMHEYVHDTVSYRAVPFDTPIPEVASNFGHERGNEENNQCTLHLPQKNLKLWFTPHLSVGRRVGDPHAILVAIAWVEVSCCTEMDPLQTTLTTLPIDDVSRPLDATNTSHLRELQKRYRP